jgi:hypothetical protein
MSILAPSRLVAATGVTVEYLKAIALSMLPLTEGLVRKIKHIKTHVS